MFESPYSSRYKALCSQLRMLSESPAAPVKEPGIKPTPTIPEAPPAPNKPPKKSPFKAPRPEVNPRPQNKRAKKFFEAYEDEAHRGTRAFFSNPDRTTLSGHPILSKHGTTLAKGAFDFTDKKTKEKNVNVRDMYGLMQLYMQIKNIESRHRDKLEKIAVDLVSEVWGIDKDMLEADLCSESEIEPNDSDDIEDVPVDDRIKKHIHMRASLNMFSHGAAIQHMISLHHMVTEELDKIDPRLIPLYDKFAAGSVHTYWFQDIEAIAEMLAGQAVGSAKVEYTEDEDGEDQPKVIGAGALFPVLVQELSKGVGILLANHHLATLDTTTANATLKNADKISLEPYYIAAGHELWRKFLTVVGQTKGVTHAEALAAIARLQPDDAHDVIENIISNPSSASQKIQRLIDSE